MPKTKPTEMPGYLSHTGDTTPPPRPTLAELAECLKVWGEMGIGIAKAKPIKSTRGVERKPRSRRVPSRVSNQEKTMPSNQAPDEQVPDETTPAKPMTRKEMRRLIAQKQVNRSEVRYFVDLYYQLQEYRKAGGNQERAAVASSEPPGEFAKSIQGNLVHTEKSIEKYLGEMAEQTTIGAWARSIVGVGPIISAALLAHIDIKEAPTVGHIWRFAGLDPTAHWIGKEKAKDRIGAHVKEGISFDGAIPIMAIEIGTKPETLRKLATSDRDGEEVPLTQATLTAACAKRPWNAKLKVVCWKLGESFVKSCNNPESFYGTVYKTRKAFEEAKNERGDFADQAAAALAGKRYGKATEAYKAYSVGKLPPAHIHARAKRYAVKLFLSGWHEVAWFAEYGKLPPKPWIMNRPEHTHLVIPPNAEMVPGLAEAHQ